MLVETNVTKVCNVCNQEKEIGEFYKGNKKCKCCTAAYKKRNYAENYSKIRAKQKKYYSKNKDKIISQVTDFRNNNPDVIKKRKSEYYENNKEKIIAYNKKREIEDRDRVLAVRRGIRERRKHKIRAYNNLKSATDIRFRLEKNLRGRVRWALKNTNAKKAASTVKLLGCSFDFFKDHICGLFKDGMTWEHFMKGEIHLDHIKPCKLFDLTNEVEQMACFNWRNIQPLWKIDNLKKGTKYGLE